LGSSGLNSAFGSDGSLPTERILKYCNIDETWAESTVFGSYTVLEVIEKLLVNDGHMGNRGFRRALFSEELGVCGTACGPHSKESTVFTLVYAKATLKIGQQPKA